VKKEDEEEEEEVVVGGRGAVGLLAGWMGWAGIRIIISTQQRERKGLRGKEVQTKENGTQTPGNYKKPRATSHTQATRLPRTWEDEDAPIFVRLRI
jgi:hypothetical protein